MTVIETCDQELRQHDALVAAGFDSYQAWQIVETALVSPSAARELVRKGCEPALAMQILEPDEGYKSSLDHEVEF